MWTPGWSCLVISFFAPPARPPRTPALTESQRNVWLLRYFISPSFLSPDINGLYLGGRHRERRREGESERKNANYTKVVGACRLKSCEEWGASLDYWAASGNKLFQEISKMLSTPSVTIYLFRTCNFCVMSLPVLFIC